MPHKQTGHRCMVIGVKSFASIYLWVKAAFDTSVFIATTWRIVSYTAEHNHALLSWQSLRGAGLPRIFRHLLRDGQQFYL